MITSLVVASGSSSVWYAYVNSDVMGKVIVVILLISSVFTWTVMIDKGVALWRAKRYSDHFFGRFRANRNNIATLVREAAALEGPIPAIYNEGMERLLEFYEEDSQTAHGYAALNVAASLRTNSSASLTPIKLSDEHLNAIQAVLEREVSMQIMGLETRIGYLATMVSVSPFIGLFGTVWGVMISFAGIAIAGKSEFTAIAPGVAGALLTTVAGLIVAIPSLVGYNLLTSTIRKLTISMDNFSEEFMVKLKLDQLAMNRARAANANEVEK